MVADKTTKKVIKTKASVTTVPASQTASSAVAPMKFDKKYIIIGILLLVAAFLFMFKSWFVVAVVNGQPISRLALIGELEKQSGKQTLNSLVTKTLILQEAKKQNINISHQEVDGEIIKIESNLKGQGKTLNDALIAQGLTRADLVEQITIQKIIEKLLGKEIQVSDQEVNAYIAKNSAQFPEGSDTPAFRAQIKQQLQQQKLSAKFQTYLAKLQKDAKISYFVQY